MKERKVDIHIIFYLTNGKYIKTIGTKFSKKDLCDINFEVNSELVEKSHKPFVGVNDYGINCELIGSWRITAKEIEKESKKVSKMKWW